MIGMYKEIAWIILAIDSEERKKSLCLINPEEILQEMLLSKQGTIFFSEFLSAMNSFIVFEPMSKTAIFPLFTVKKSSLEVPPLG